MTDIGLPLEWPCREQRVKPTSVGRWHCRREIPWYRRWFQRAAVRSVADRQITGVASYRTWPVRTRTALPSFIHRHLPTGSDLDIIYPRRNTGRVRYVPASLPTEHCRWRLPMLCVQCWVYGSFPGCEVEPDAIGTAAARITAHLSVEQSIRKHVIVLDSLISRWF